MNVDKMGIEEAEMYLRHAQELIGADPSEAEVSGAKALLHDNATDFEASD